MPVGYCKKCSCYSECTSYSSVCAELNALLPLGAVGSLDVSRVIEMALLLHPNLSSGLENNAEFGLPLRL